MRMNFLIALAFLCLQLLLLVLKIRLQSVSGFLIYRLHLLSYLHNQQLIVTAHLSLCCHSRLIQPCRLQSSLWLFELLLVQVHMVLHCYPMPTLISTLPCSHHHSPNSLSHPVQIAQLVFRELFPHLLLKQLLFNHPIQWSRGARLGFSSQKPG